MSVHTHEPALSAWLAGNHGVVTRSKLAELGYSTREVRTLLDSSRLVRFHPGIYLATSAPRTELQRIRAQIEFSAGVASHSTAGQLWGFRKLTRYRVLHFSVAHGRNVSPPGCRLHQSRDLPVTDWEVRDDGIALTTPVRTMFDLAAICSPDDLESIIEQGLDRQMFTIPDLHEIGRRLARPGRDGSAAFATVMARREIWRRPAQSDLELRLFRALSRAGFSPIEQQFPVRLKTGEVIHADLAIPSRRVLIEVDHVTWHGGRLENMYDRWRDRQCHRLGWHTERVPDVDLGKRLAQTVRELTEVIVARPVWSGPVSQRGTEPLQRPEGIEPAPA